MISSTDCNWNIIYPWFTVLVSTNFKEFLAINVLCVGVQICRLQQGVPELYHKDLPVKPDFPRAAWLINLHFSVQKEPLKFFIKRSYYRRLQ